MEITQLEKDKLIKIFVSYYGEQHRDFITKQINETEFVTVSSIVNSAEGGILFQGPKQTNTSDPEALIRDAVTKIKGQQSMEESKFEEDNVIKFYNDLSEKYPQLANVKLDYTLSYKIRNMLKASSSPEFYTDNMLEIFTQLGIPFDSLEEIKQSDISEIISAHDPNKTLAEIDKKYKRELAKVDTSYQASIKKLQAIPNIKQKCLDGLIESVDAFLLSSRKPQAFFTTYLTNDNQLHRMIVLPENFNDHQLIHELNHAIECSLLKCSEDGYMCVSGFDKLKTDFSDTPADYEGLDKTHRKHEKFNEVVNEFVTEGIMDCAKEQGISITSNTSRGSGYDIGVSLAYKFIRTYKTELANCRLSNNPLEFKEIIGEENFDQISSALRTLMSYSSLQFMDIYGTLERKSGQTFKGIANFANQAEDLLNLDLTKAEREILESAKSYIEVSESLIMAKQESLTN